MNDKEFGQFTTQIEGRLKPPTPEAQREAINIAIQMTGDGPWIGHFSPSNAAKVLKSEGFSVIGLKMRLLEIDTKNQAQCIDEETIPPGLYEAASEPLMKTYPAIHDIPARSFPFILVRQIDEKAIDPSRLYRIRADSFSFMPPEATESDSIIGHQDHLRFWIQNIRL